MSDVGGLQHVLRYPVMGRLRRTIADASVGGRGKLTGGGDRRTSGCARATSPAHGAGAKIARTPESLKIRAGARFPVTFACNLSLDDERNSMMFRNKMADAPL
jgi:hypothetical protein